MLNAAPVDAIAVADLVAALVRKSPLPGDTDAHPITEADLPFLQALFAEIRGAEVAATGWPIERQRSFLAEQFDCQHRYYTAHFTHAAFLLLSRAGRPVGRLYAQACNGLLSLIDISLVAELRGQGLGSALLSRLIALADAHGMSMSLAVEPNNPARRLYERHGFAVADASGFYLRMLRPAHATEAA